MMDDMNVIAKKIKSAVTDSEGVIEYRENDPTKAGINNLLSIMSAVTGRNIESIVKDYSGKGYGDFKNDVAEAVVECIRPIRNEYDKLIADKLFVFSCGNNASYYLANYHVNLQIYVSTAMQNLYCQIPHG